MGVERVLKITNHTNLPQPIYDALTHDSYSRGASNYSVTQLIDSPRVRLLRKQHDDEIEEDCCDMVWSVLGTAVHKMFEQHQPEGHVVEERLFAKVGNYTISGAIDLQRSEADNSVTLVDYKTTSVWSVVYGKQEWHRQLNFYAWLAEQKDGVEVSALQIVAVLRDWQRSKAGEANYPEAPIVVVEIPSWTKEERQAYVEERVSLHTQADFNQFSGQAIPLCSDDERWKKEDVYAVKKPRNKRAIKLFDDEESAKKFIGDQKELEIEVRQGKYTRCQDNWCRVSAWCDQHNEGV